MGKASRDACTVRQGTRPGLWVGHNCRRRGLYRTFRRSQRLAGGAGIGQARRQPLTLETMPETAALWRSRFTTYDLRTPAARAPPRETRHFFGLSESFFSSSSGADADSVTCTGGVTACSVDATTTFLGRSMSAVISPDPSGSVPPDPSGGGAPGPLEPGQAPPSTP